MMLVSCVCPTYNRPAQYQYLLEEAIESFVRQDYPDKELIVLNDTVGQELICDSPAVRVINSSHRYKTLGGKYNAMVEFSNGELLCPWEDDDVCLPWRLSISIAMLGQEDYYNPQRYWFLDGRGLHREDTHGVCHACSIYRKLAWEKVGGYPEISGPQDAVMDGKLKAGCRVVKHKPHDARLWDYIYRWGVSPCHTSTSRYPGETYQRIGNQKIDEGTFELRPHWKMDYTKLCLEKAWSEVCPN